MISWYSGNNTCYRVSPAQFQILIMPLSKRRDPESISSLHKVVLRRKGSDTCEVPTQPSACPQQMGLSKSSMTQIQTQKHIWPQPKGQERVRSPSASLQEREVHPTSEPTAVFPRSCLVSFTCSMSPQPLDASHLALLVSQITIEKYIFLCPVHVIIIFILFIIGSAKCQWQVAVAYRNL